MSHTATGFMAEEPRLDPALVAFYKRLLDSRPCEFSGCPNIADRLVAGKWWLCNFHDWEVE